MGIITEAAEITPIMLGFIVSTIVPIASASVQPSGPQIVALRRIHPRPAPDWNAIIATLSAAVTFVGAVLTLVMKTRKDDLEIKKMRLEIEELRKKVGG